jgi:isocitrate dehydrogenase
MDAKLQIILVAGAKLEIDEIKLVEKVYLAGNTSGIDSESWENIMLNNKIAKQ